MNEELNNIINTDFAYLFVDELNKINQGKRSKQGNVDNPYQENIYDTSNLFDNAYSDSENNPNPQPQLEIEP